MDDRRHHMIFAQAQSFDEEPACVAACGGSVHILPAGPTNSRRIDGSRHCADG
jgi:hypothetical protein